MPLGSLQRQFLDPSMVVDTALALRTTASVEQIFEAVRRVCRRHSAMRTQIDPAALEQRVYESRTAGVRCTLLDPLDDETALVRLAAPAGDPIRVDILPVYRCTLARTAGDETLLHLASHHTLTDRTSMHVLIQEIATLLGTGASLPPAHSFHTYLRDQMGLVASDATWAEGGRGQRAIRHWDAVLDGAFAPQLGAAPDAPSTGTAPLQRFVMPVEPAVASRAAALATELRVSRFHVYLVGYALALAQHTGARDIATMCLTHGRNTPATRDMVGLLVVDIVIRHRFGSATPRELIAASSVQAMEAYRHHTTAITELARRSEIVRAFLRQRKVRRLMFQYRPHAIGEGVRWPGGQTARPIAASLEEGWRIPGVLLFSVDESEQRTSIETLYDPEAFTAASVEAFSHEFVEACRRLLGGPDQPLAASPGL
jgi:hypothetical protein